MLDPKLLSFIKVNEKGSYTLAAKELSLSQPAVSQHIRLLEEETGVRLFNRGDGQMKLTIEGETVLKYARRIASLYEDMTRKLKDERLGKRSYVIGITHTSEANLIAEVLASYASEHPGVRIKIKSDSITRLYERLSNYEIDLAIVDGNPTSRKYSSILLDTDSLVAVMARSHPLALSSSVKIDDLRKVPLILRSKSSETRSLFASALASLSLGIDDFNVVLEIDNIMTIKELVAKGEIVSVLPRSACHGHGDKESLAIRPIENLTMVREVNVVFPRDFEDRGFLDAIIDGYHRRLSS